MSIPVPVEDLADVVERYGYRPFLLTTGEDDRPHATHVAVAVEANRISCAIGRRTGRNGTARALVSLVWPPVETEGYSLIVDGEITVDGDPESPTATVVVTNAVLHRPAPGGQAADTVCGSDCVDIRIPEG